MSTVEQLEQRVNALEEQVRLVLDQRRELALIREAVLNHTMKHADHTFRLDILIDRTAEIMAILRSRGQG